MLLEILLILYVLTFIASSVGSISVTERMLNICRYRPDMINIIDSQFSTTRSVLDVPKHQLHIGCLIVSFIPIINLLTLIGAVLKLKMDTEEFIESFRKNEN